MNKSTGNGAVNTNGVYSSNESANVGFAADVGTNSNENIGMAGRAWNVTSSQTIPNVNIGIYGMATSANTNWAGYFASGNVKIENNLEIDGNIKITGSSHSNGAVLTSDGSGNATWQQPAGSGGSNSKTFNYLSDGF